MQSWRIGWRRAGALVFAIGLLSGCLLTSNFDGLTGGLVPVDGGADTGSGGASSSASASSTSAGSGSAAGGGTSSSSASSTGAGGNVFPMTPVLDDFHRPDGALGGQWLKELPDTWIITGWKLHTDGMIVGIGGAMGRPGSIVWPTMFGAEQEAYFTFAADGPGVFEAELLLKHQGPPNECDSVVVAYHPPTVDLYICQGGKFDKHPNSVDATFGNGDQLGARAHADGSVEAFKNGMLIMTWDASAWAISKGSGQIGIEADGINGAGVLLLRDFGGG